MNSIIRKTKEIKSVRLVWIRFAALREIFRWSISRRHASSALDRAKGLINTLNPFFSPSFIVLLSHKRSGSTLFCNLAAQYNGVLSAYEVLNPIAFPEHSFRNVEELTIFVRMVCKRNQCCVVKVFPEHLISNNIGWEDIRQLFPRAMWFHLVRRDVLLQYVSLKRAESSNVWLLGERDLSANPPSISIDVEKFKRYRDQILENDRKISGTFSGNNYHRFSYEEFTENPVEWFNSVFCQKTGFHPSEVKVAYRKQGSDGLAGISNSSELSTIRYELRMHTI